MAYAARIERDSVNEFGNRLTTFVVTYPRFVHSEMMTHRVFSRNSSSSRAIPNHKLILQIQLDPAGPVFWGKNQSGMQAKEELSAKQISMAQAEWIEARDCALLHARRLANLGAHKQIVNRILEPWMWITVIITATEWENFFNLRCHIDAQPEIQKIAYMMRDLYETSIPQSLGKFEWHLPFVEVDEMGDYRKSLALSVARCARVSYLTHDGQHDPEKDLQLAQRLNAAKHLSPFEHQATPIRLDRATPAGNFVGWHQHRHSRQAHAYQRDLPEVL